MGLEAVEVKRTCSKTRGARSPREQATDLRRTTRKYYNASGKIRYELSIQTVVYIREEVCACPVLSKPTGPAGREAERRGRANGLIELRIFTSCIIQRRHRD